MLVEICNKTLVFHMASEAGIYEHPSTSMLLSSISHGRLGRIIRFHKSLLFLMTKGMKKSEAK